jgi:hypothetical protein
MGCTACFSFSFDGDFEVKRVPEVAGGDGPAGALVRNLNGYTVRRGIVGHAKLPGEEEPALRIAYELVGHDWLANISWFSGMVWLAFGVLVFYSGMARSCVLGFSQPHGSLLRFGLLAANGSLVISGLLAKLWLAG